MSLQTIARNPSTNFGTTSGEGLRARRRTKLLLLNRAPTDLGTATGARWVDLPYSFFGESTVSCSAFKNPGAAVDQEPEDTRRAISELRRISGLTWEQLSQLFEVSRRSVHLWASGRPLRAENEARLMRVLEVVRYADRGDARSNRRVLLNADRGLSPFNLLMGERFDDAKVALGQGVGRAAPLRSELSSEAKAARRPLPPESLFDAKHDLVHVEPGGARGARTARNRRRGRS